MPKAGAMFYGSQEFHPAELFLMLPEAPEDVAHEPERDLFALKWPGLTLLIMRLDEAARKQNLRVFGESGGERLLGRVCINEVLGLRWEGPDPKGLVDTILQTLCDVCGGFYVRDGQVLGARGPVPL